VSYRIRLTQSAVTDLDDLAQWIDRNDSIDGELNVLSEIESRIDLLDSQPERGSFPPELRALGMTKYRELFFKPYRVIYEIRSKTVVVHLIADGRRDFSSLLQRRLTE